VVHGRVGRQMENMASFLEERIEQYPARGSREKCVRVLEAAADTRAAFLQFRQRESMRYRDDTSIFLTRL